MGVLVYLSVLVTTVLATLWLALVAALVGGSGGFNKKGYLVITIVSISVVYGWNYLLADVTSISCTG